METSPDLPGAAPEASLGSPPATLRSDHLLAAALFLVMLAGGTVRWFAAQGDLWFDEIWSMWLGSGVRSLLGVFTEIHHDNNHYLNTLWLLAVGAAAPTWLYRLPALVSGTAVIGLMAADVPGRSGLERLTSALLGAGSLWLVQYSSEARGYGVAIGCSLVCYLTMERWLRTGAWRWALGFAASAMLGLLAHLTSLFVIAGCLAWAMLASWHMPWRRICAGAGAVVVPPSATLVALYFVDVRAWAKVREAMPWTARGVASELMSNAFNLPPGPFEALVLCAAILAAVEIAWLARRGDPRWLFFASTVFVTPAFVILLQPQNVGGRFFVVAVPFLLMLAGTTLARLPRAFGRWGLLVWALLLLAFLVSGGIQVGRLIAHGHGRYSEAVSYVADHSGGPIATVGGDHDSRNGLLVAFYAHQSSPSRPVRYIMAAQAALLPPEWYLVQEPQPAGVPPADEVRIEGGAAYRIVKTFPHGGLSGWDWILYRRDR